MSKYNLSEEEIHIWTGSLDWPEQRIQASYQCLTEKEQARADRFIVERPRLQYIISTTTLREILSYYLDCSAEQIQFEYETHGKPFLPAIQFNMSHSQEVVAVAVTKNQALGIDVEHCSSRVEAEQLTERFFCESEREQFFSVPETERQAAFYSLWTRKEAFIKATGLGLSFGLENFVVDLQAGGMDCLLSVKGSAKLAQQWSLGPILPELINYKAAIAVFGQVSRLTYHEFT